MSAQGKKRRRLYYLLAGTLVISALGGAAALFRMHYIKERALKGREDGLAAMAQSDYPTALTQLGKYLSRYPNDVDILLPYAKARRNVVQPKHQELGQAIGLYQRALELRPGLPEARQSLLQLYYQVGYNAEAISLAETILAQTPTDAELAKTPAAIEALRIKIGTLMRLQRFATVEKSGKKEKGAEEEALHLAAVTPLTLDSHMLVIDIMIKEGKQAGVEKYAGDLARAHPDDPHFDLLRSIAAARMGDRNSAINFARPLAARPQADVAYTRALIRQLDNLELFADSFTVLQKAMVGNTDHDMMLLWISRLFESNHLSLLVDQTAGLDPTAAGSDVQLLGMRALALARLDRHPEAVQIADALDKRGHAESSAAHWAAIVHAAVPADSSDPILTIRSLQEALAGNSISSAFTPIVLEEMGDAYAAAGAHDKASATWVTVKDMAPVWSAPFVRLSQALVSGGHPAEALAGAKVALERAPDDRDALMSLAIASAASLPNGPSPDAVKVLAQIADIQQRLPQESGLVPLKAGILIQTQQRDAAVQVIKSALAAQPAEPESVLLALARLSESFHLDQDEACFAASEKAHGLTPDLAFARARWLQDHQRGPEGVTLLEKARTGHSTDDPKWRNAWAAFLDLIGDPRAKNEWVALGDGNPKNVKLQWAALSANSVQADHEFVGRTIDRLVEMIGEDSVALRLARARWLLQGQSSEKDATQASIILSDISRASPDMVPPRLLLATCYMRLGNVNGALDQLTLVSDMQPEQAGIALELAQMLQSRGDFTRARQFIDRATRSKAATVQDMRLAASLLALQGDYTTAASLLEKAYAGTSQLPPDLVLAALYRQLNQPKKVEEICRQLLANPDAAGVAFSADFYASQGRPEDAQHALALLDALKLRPGAKELLLADYAAHHETFDQALKRYQAAVAAAPNEPVVWHQMVAYFLAAGKLDEALAKADEATQKLGSIAGFDQLRDNAGLVKDAAKLPGTRQLLVMLTGAGAGDTPVLDALRIMVAANRAKEAARDTAAKLRKLADANPRVLPLQIITLQFYVEAGQRDDAVSMATHVAQAFPGTVEPLRLATNVLGAAQHWDQALGTAKEWKRAGTGETLDADLAIASAELNLGDTNASSQQIQPYLDRAMADPDKYSGVILLQAQGLLAAHKPEQAEALLGPLMQKSAQWRGLWLNLAVRSVEDSARSQAWLEKAAPLMSQDPGEKTELAEAWIAVGKRWKNADFDTKGRTLLESVVQLPDPPVKALLLRGSLYEAVPDWNNADRIYRQALKKEPENAILHNNLAWVLVNRSGDLNEAQQEIAKALHIQPNAPSFLDTQAAVLAARKDYSGAEASLNDAKRLDPGNVEWPIHMLAILIDSAQMSKAKSEDLKVAALLAGMPNVAPALRERYESLHSKVH